MDKKTLFHRLGIVLETCYSDSPNSKQSPNSKHRNRVSKKSPTKKVKPLLAVKGREVLEIVVDVLNKELRRVMGRKENIIHM